MSKILEFLSKEAGSGWGGLGGELVEGGVGVIPYLFGIPLAGGAAVGYLASKMSSPGDSDREALQQRVIDTEVREEVGIQQRKLQALKARLKEQAMKNKKAISHKRDMFA
jgi:hypothetical protein